MSISTNIKITLATLSLFGVAQFASANERKNEYNALSVAVIEQSTLPLRMLKSNGFDLSTIKQRKEAAQFVITSMITLLENNRCPTAHDFTQARSMISLSEQIYQENKRSEPPSLETDMIYWQLAKRVHKDLLEMDAKKALCDIDLALDRMKK